MIFSFFLLRRDPENILEFPIALNVLFGAVHGFSTWVQRTSVAALNSPKSTAWCPGRFALAELPDQAFRV